MMPKISIVVPVYRVQKYLDRCVKSLIKQSYSNIEIILVDDGSTDKCPELCDNYAKSDLRIMVIHKKNGGLSDARNCGIKVATGDYILFVDSDDFIELDACEYFAKIIDTCEVDIVAGNAKRIEDSHVSLMQRYLYDEKRIISGKEFLKSEFKYGTMYMAAWLNLYNRSFLIDNKLEFKVGLLHEDEQFTPRVFLKANRVMVSNMVFYNYIIREGSISTQKNKIKNAEHLMQTCKELERIYNRLADDELKKLLNDDLVNKFLNIFQEASLYKKKYSYLIDISFLKGKALTKKNKLRVVLFHLSRRGYYFINYMKKYI